MPYTYDYPRPMVTVDILLVHRGEGGRSVLLIERGHPPFQGRWALPGGFLDEDEGLEAAARRELAEETNLTDLELIQLGAWGDPGRDPRGHTVTVVFGAVLEEQSPREAVAGDDARDARWWPLEALPPLAFDHDRIIADGVRRLGK